MEHKIKEVDYSLGCRLPVEDWAWLNRTGIFSNPSLRQYVSPFPPVELIENVSGLQNEKDFASHGADLFVALSEATPVSMNEYHSILDFGCGCGRLARMFKGHPHRVSGCDIDNRHVEWVNKNLNHMKATRTSVNPPLPYNDNEFDAVISISIFTHLTEKKQDEFLSELHRICRPGGSLFLTVHGEQALKRAIKEKSIRDMIWVEETPFQKAMKEFAQNKHAFILQNGHLTTVQKNSSLRSRLRNLFVAKKQFITEPYEYGITFIPELYMRNHWSTWFEIVDYRHGAIHNFQDIVVLTPRK